jgi:cytochrome P450
MLVVGLLLTIIILIYIYLKSHYSSSPDDPPGIKPQILFGNLINTGVLSGKKAFHEVLFDLQHRLGDVYQYWLGPNQCLVFCRLEHVEAIFKNRHIFELSPLSTSDIDFMTPNGIGSAIGTKWKRHARFLLPLFKRANIVDYFDIIVRCTDRFIDRELHPDQIHRNLVAKLQSLTLNILGFITLNRNFDADGNSQIEVALEEFSSIINIFFKMPWVPAWFWRIFLKLNWKYQRVYQIIYKLVEEVFEQERENRSKMKNERPKSLIASLITSLSEETDVEQTSSGLTRSQILDNVMSLVTMGYGQVGTILAWFVFFVSKNSSVQERMKDELRQYNLMMSKDLESTTLLTEEKLSSLIYCECVMKEVGSL